MPGFDYFLTDVEGETIAFSYVEPRRRGRPRKASYRDIAGHFGQLLWHTSNRKCAVSDTARHFGIDRATVFEALRRDSGS